MTTATLRTRARMEHDAPPPAPLPPARVLALDLGPIAADIAGVAKSRLSLARSQDLSAALLAAVAPDHILLPLFAPGLDASATIEHLVELGYGGEITVIGPALPDPAMVERELRALGPGKNLRLLTPQAGGSG